MTMAKVRIQCQECGTWFDHRHTCVNSAARDQYEAWATANITVCPACAAKARRAKAEAEQQEAVRTATADTELVQLAGSPKQIAWAEDIRRKAVAMIGATGKQISAKAVEKINAKTEAKWWIENRNRLDNVQDFAIALSKNI